MQHFMLIPLAQVTIAILKIANGGSFNYPKNDGGLILSIADIVLKLEARNIIRLKVGQTKGDLSFYELTLPTNLITLLDILEAIGEKIDYEVFTPEELSLFKGHIICNRKVVKRMIYAYLETIKLVNLEKKQCLLNQLPINEK